MSSLSIDASFSSLCAEAEAARAAGDLPAAAFAYAIAITMLPPEGNAKQLFDLRLARAVCLHGAGDYSAEAEELAQLDALTAELGDQGRRVTVSLQRASWLLAGGDAAAAQLVAATALAEARSAADAGHEAASLLALAEAAHALSDFATAATRAEKALATFIALGDHRGEAAARRVLGLAIHGAGGDAMSQLRAALLLCRSIGDRGGEALTLNAIGAGSTDMAEARAAYIQGLAIAESIGDRESEALLANNLGTVYLSLGLFGQARAYAIRAVRIARALGARDMLAGFLESLGRSYGGLGQAESARVALREAFALAESIGSRGTAAIALIGLARAALSAGRFTEAGRDLDQAITLCAAVGARADHATALAWRAAAHLMARELTAADALSARALELIEAGGKGEFPPQEIWWQRYRVLVALAGAAGSEADAQAQLAAARTALDHARTLMFEAIATLSDVGLRRSYLGRVSVNRAIIETLAALAEPHEIVPPAPPPLSRDGLQDQMTRLLGVTARLSDLSDPAALRTIFLDELVELCGAERLLLLLGASLEAPEALIVHGVNPEDLDTLRDGVMPTLREALRRRRPIGLEAPPCPSDAGPPALRPRSALAVPLISGARTVGAFYADVRSFFGPFGASDFDLIALLVAQAATALENARLYAQTLRAKEDLERQVAERTADLLAANRALAERAAEAQAAHATAEAASAAKSAFLANISHELRTPLNAVIGFAQVLQRDQGLSKRQHELLHIIGRSGDHLLGLINDVLELSKIEAGRLAISPAPFDLHTLLAELESLFRLRADARHISLVLRVGATVPRYVIGDEGRLRQVLLNLLGNAFKFTHEGEVRVEADATPEGAHLRLRIAVADTGEGIEADDLRLLFQPFTQTESGRRTHEGTGLGLALSRQLARLMGGDISASSLPATGSTFVVEILVDPATAPPEALQTSQVIGLVTAGRRYRILVAEEDWQTRRLLAEWLQEAGVEVREVADGAQALSVWSDWHPHVVLLDSGLSVIDGCEVARRIRESPGGRATVVIALADPPTCPQADYEALLPRPVRHDELLACVAIQLGLDLRYAEAETPAVEAPLSRDELAGLPPGVRRQLADAAASSDPAAVATAIARIDAGWPSLGRRLATLADEFQFEAIELLASDG